MREFITWCFDPLEAPFLVLMFSLLIATAFLVIYVITAIAFFAMGLWVVGLTMLFAVPIYAIIRAYKNRQD